MMNPLRVPDQDGVETTYACIHWRMFPPRSAYSENGIEELRADGDVTDAEYQRHQIWERDCGLLEMSADKCLGCKHARKLVLIPHQTPKLVTLDGMTSTPSIDMSTFASQSHIGTPRGRVSHQAAWLKHAAKIEKPKED